MKKRLIDLLTVLSLMSLVFIVYIQHRKIETLKNYNKEAVTICDSLRNNLKDYDSIRSELFVKDIECGRYEYILDRADSELSKDCARQLDEIKGQTE